MRLLPHDDVVAVRSAEDEFAADCQARNGSDVVGENGERFVGVGE